MKPGGIGNDGVRLPAENAARPAEWLDVNLDLCVRRDPIAVDDLDEGAKRCMERDGMLYRIEGAFSKARARKIAESMR